MRTNIYIGTATIQKKEDILKGSNAELRGIGSKSFNSQYTVRPLGAISGSILGSDRRC